MAYPQYADFKKWPYPVHYRKENEIETDVLFIGGGIAGSHGAISAVKKSARVAVVDKGPVNYYGLSHESKGRVEEKGNRGIFQARNEEPAAPK